MLQCCYNLSDGSVEIQAYSQIVLSDEAKKKKSEEPHGETLETKETAPPSSPRQDPSMPRKEKSKVSILLPEAETVALQEAAAFSSSPLDSQSHASPAAKSTTLRLQDDISPTNSSRSLKSFKSFRSSTTKMDLEKLEVPIKLRRGSSVQDLEGGLGNDYELEDELGHGGFGSVFVGRGKKDDSKTVAVKMIPRARLKREDIFTEEVNNSKRLAHPNVIQLFASYRDETNFYLVMEYCKGGSLSELVQARGLQKDEMGIWTVGLPTDMIAKYAWQMLSGLAYLHYHRIVHRDVKLENYMRVSTDEYASIKLIDFGLATTLQRGTKLRDVVGTVLTMAPEVRRRNYDEKVDVWGAGMCLYVCAVAMDPWFNEETHRQFEEEDIFEALEDPELEIRYYERRWSLKEAGVRKLVGLLLVTDPAKRPRAKDVLLEDKWLRANGREGACCCTIA